jgi:predicted CopG family antitoxin
MAEMRASNEYDKLIFNLKRDFGLGLNMFRLTANEVSILLAHYENYKGEDFSNKKDNTSLSIAIHVDCSEALKGLKAVTRETNRASAALKELETQQKKTCEIHMNTLTINNESDVKKIASELIKSLAASNLNNAGKA